MRMDEKGVDICEVKKLSCFSILIQAATSLPPPGSLNTPLHTVQESTSSPLRQSFNAVPPFMHGCCCMQANSA